MGKGKRKEVAKVATTLNRATGKESKAATGFNDAQWGNLAKQYLTSVNNLTDDAYRHICDMSQQLVKTNGRARHTATSGNSLDENNEDERALLRDDCNFCSAFCTS